MTVNRDLQQLGLSILSAALFLAAGYYVLSRGHPHEDAYILFIYAENWAHTGTINYYPGGPPTEGATDFLWMAMIAALNLAGLNSGIAALLLNGIGTALICWVLLRAISDVHYSGGLAAFVVLFLPVFLISQASLAGFSASLYAAIVVVVIRGLHRWQGQRLCLIPVLCLVLALFRPDGIIIAASATVIAAFYTTRAERRAYLAAVVLCALIGLAYFAWRWTYFGEFLPLPLYVKSEGDRILNGLAANLDWLKFNAVLLILSAVSVLACRAALGRYLWAAVPVLLLVVALAFAVQSQNIAYRLNAPGSVLLLYGAVIGAAFLLRRARQQAGTVAVPVYLAVALAGAIGFGQNAVAGLGLVRILTNDDAINYFPFYLSDHIPEDTTIALSEAGRFAYWMPGRKIDLVGLNTSETARNGATADYVASLNPDIVFVHTAGIVRHDCAAGENYCQVSAQEFEQILQGGRDRLNRPVKRRVPQATIAAIRFLEDNAGRYAIYFVRYGGGFFHLFGVRHDGAVRSGDFQRSLERSFDPAARLSYLDMIRARSEEAGNL